MKGAGEDPNKLRFRNVNILNLKGEVENLEKPEQLNPLSITNSEKASLTSYHTHLFKNASYYIAYKRDKLINTSTSPSSIRYWIVKLGSNIKSLVGKGIGILNPDIF